MSYAQRHRNRVELHQLELEQTPPNVSAASAAAPNDRTPVQLQDMVVDMRPQHQPTRSDSGPCRSGYSWRRWNGINGTPLDAHDGSTAFYPRPLSVTGTSAVAWSETASSVGSAEVPRRLFQLLQRTPMHSPPPRLKASRKEFASPNSSITTTAAAAGQPPTHGSLRGRAVENAVDERSRTSPPYQPDVLHGTPANEFCGSRPHSAESDRCAYGQAQHASDESPSNGMFLPSPAPDFAASSATSSSRLSTSHCSASETFAARLRNIMETRRRIELLVQKQRQDEEEMVHAIESLGEQPQQDGAADRPLYEEALVERATAFAALREFKERGNIIVRKLYATVMTQQEQALELVATVEALKKANKRLKDSLSNGSGAAGGGLDSGAGAAATEGSATRAPDTVAELQERVVMQRRVIEQMDELMQNADRMLLAMRARVEAAERRAGGATAECQQLPPLPLTPGSATLNSRSPCRTPVGGGGAVMVDIPDAEAAMERLTARYASDSDVATVSAQLQLLWDRAAQLRQALKREQAQRLHLEEVYDATYAETARNVALLEERLQRVQSTRGVIYGSSSPTNVSALPMEQRILLGERVSEGGAATADGIHHEDKEQYTLPQSSSHSSSSTRTAIAATASAAEDEDEMRKSDPKNSGGSADPTVLEGVTAVPNDQSKKEPHRSKSRQPSKPAAAQSAGQLRTYLGDFRRADGSADDDAAAEEAETLLLSIPVPDASTLGASARHSLNSRSSSVSQRLVSFRSAKATAVTSRYPGSVSDKEEYDDEVHVSVVSSGSNARGGAAVTAAAIATVTHAYSSPLLDTTTSAGSSAVPQQPSNRRESDLSNLDAIGIESAACAFSSSFPVLSVTPPSRRTPEMPLQQHHYTASSAVHSPLSGGGISSTSVFLLDLGSRTIKSGLHTAKTPHLTPSLVGTPKYPRCLPQASSSSNQSRSVSASRFVVGEDAASRRGLLRLSRPIQHGGIITDWEGAQPLLRECIQSALVPATSSPVARLPLEEGEEVIYSLVESPLASRPQRARLAELLFEGPGQEAVVSDGHQQERVGPRAAGVFCGVGPLLALYATGQTTGLVIDVGDGAVSTAAAVDGYALPQCLQREADGATGATVTSYLTRLLYQSGVLGPAAAVAAFRRDSPPSLFGTATNGFSSPTGAGTEQERDLVYAIKEACCHVSATPLLTKPFLATASTSNAAMPSLDELNSALIAAAQRTQQSGFGGGDAHAGALPSHCFTLPDGSSVEVGAAEAAQASEVLFYPLLMGSEGRGVVDMVLDAVAAAPVELQPQLLGNVVVTGGATCTHGFGCRFFKEVLQRVGGSSASLTSGASNQRICVSAPEQRAYAAWMGASYVAHLSSFASNMVVTRAVYEEEGEAALARTVLT